MTWASRSARRQHLPPDWERRRQNTLRQDRGLCRQCGTQAATWTGRRWAGGQVDHITPGDDHTQLQTLCTPCHQAKTSREGHAKRVRTARPAEPHPGVTR